MAKKYVYCNMLFIVIVITSLYICYKDITERRIPNITQYVLLLTGFMHLAVYGNAAAGWTSLYVPFGLISIGILLARLNTVGLGDVKLIFTTLLLVGESNYYGTLMFIVFTGGVWSLVWHFILAKLAFIKKIDGIRVGIPYGIPIVTGLCLFTYIS